MSERIQFGGQFPDDFMTKMLYVPLNFCSWLVALGLEYRNWRHELRQAWEVLEVILKMEANTLYAALHLT